MREGLTEGRATNLKEESYEAGFNLSGALAERVLNVYRAFESLPYGFSSKFRSKVQIDFSARVRVLFIDRSTCHVRAYTYTWLWHLWIVAVVATQ